MVRSSFFSRDLFRHSVEAVACPYLADQVECERLFIVQYGLDDGLESGVPGLQVIAVVLVYTFPAVVGVGIVDAFWKSMDIISHVSVTL